MTLTYREYVRREREALASPAAEEYWRLQLADAELVELPQWPAEWLGREVPRMRRSAVALTPEVVAGLKRLAREAAVPLKSVLLAAHLKALSLLAGRDDVVSGLVANSRLEESEGDQVRGLFLNTLPLRLRLPAGSWADLVRAAFAAEQEMLPHRRYPFGILQRQSGDRPLFEISFNYTHFHVVRDLMRSGSLEILGFRQAEGGSLKMQVHFYQDLEQRGVGLEFEYDSYAVPAVLAREIGDGYSRILELMAGDARSSHQEAAVLPSAVRHRLLREWNDTEVELPGGRRCLHELVAEAAARTPEATAVVHEERSLSFAELDAGANRLARHLRELGVGPEVRVAVLADRSLDVIVALLGVLKAGGAYLPLDPGYPRERLAFMVEDAQPQVLLTERRFSGLLPPHSLATVLLDEDAARIAGRSPAPFAGGAVPANLAYVIYTSGSTGRPKGVMVPHRAILNRLLWMQRRVPLAAGDRVALKTPLSFDASVWEVFVPLLAGATVVVARPGGHQESAYLVDLVARQEVTVLQLVPSMLRIFLEEPELPSCTRLRRVFSGGEELPVHVRERFFALLDAELHNLYGPTETAIDAASWPCHPDPAERAVPIGRPIDNMRIQLLDSRLSPVAIGVAGELYVAGVGISRGYLGRPDLTAEKMVPNPFPFAPGERLYRTGDLARYRPEGALEFLGRQDHQVKVRGFRIEPGEIEAALERLPLVAQAVVLVRQLAGDAQLVAYVVPAGGQDPRPGHLRTALREALPEHMIPAAFVILAALPVAPNGKLDRAALPQPEAAAEASPAAPRGLAQELLASLWADVLGRERVGANDNFFELGGHSLLATRLISRVRATFQVEIPLRRLFDAPTVAGLAAVIEEEKDRSAVSAPPIVPVGRDREIPLSFAQQRLWFIDQLRPGESNYNIPLPLRIEGRLDAALLGRTLSEVVRRHEVLRTHFRDVAGRGVQVIHPPLPVLPPSVDLGALPRGAAEAEAQRLALAESVRPFDLGGDDLLRLTLLRMDAEGSDHVALFTLHHIISDGWSTGVLVREVMAIYEAFAAGLPSPLPELPIQFADFAVWQREWLTGEVLESQLAYWKARLAGAPAFLDLPTDRPRPALQSTAGASRPVRYGASLLGRLGALSRREGVTPFMSLLAVFQALLCRYSGQTDVVVGTPSAGRDRLELEPLIGFFINTLPIRTEIAASIGFRRLLAEVRTATLDAYVHQDLPFEKLVDELGLERRLSHTPLFQVMFALQNLPEEELKLPGLAVRPLNVGLQTVKFDLTLNVEERGGELVGGLGYSTDLWDEETMDRLLLHLGSLLEGVVAEPEARVLELALLTPVERHQLLAEWNDTELELPGGRRCLHELVAEQAARTPEATAVVFAERALSFAELDAGANRLARHLRELGVGPEVRVAILAERSLDVIVALLGVLKAGGAYLPLDPGYPRERLEFMVEDARPQVLITESRFTGVLPPHSLATVRLDEDAAQIAGRSSAPFASGAVAANLAYVIYTSGSTGRPKGVMVPHRAILNRLLWMQRRVPLVSGDRVALKTPLSFDASVWEVFVPLLAGATVVVARPGGHQESAYLVELVARQEVTVLQLVPSMLRIFLEEPELPSCTRLRRVFSGGEELPVHVRERFFSLLDAELHNLYGPTETAIDAAYSPCHSDPAERAVPIGRPIDNMRIHLLDSRLSLVPTGVAGELYVAGVGLSRGYLGRPDLTAEKMVPDPFSLAPGERLYRTGDLARSRPGGAIEFLRRQDHQVKVRGFRIEPGEIEAALESLSLVAQAVVLVRQLAGDSQLVAYVVPAGGHDPRPGDLRTALREALPEHMIPAAFVLLAALPVAPNGKLDRSALPEPELAAELSPTAPRGPVEELLAGLWGDVLGLERVGVHDSFFELGGHSLLATRLISRVRAAFQVEIPLRRLFDAPTVAGLAAVIERARRSDGAPQPPSFHRLLPGAAGASPPPLSFAQERFWAGRQAEARTKAPNTLPMMVRFEGDLDLFCLRRTLQEIVDRHEVLRTSFREDASGVVQVVHPDLPVHLPVVDLERLAPADRMPEVRRLAALDVRTHFDYERAPLFRLTLFRCSAGERVLLFTIHHIAFDGWSQAVLGGELAALYSAFRAGRPSPLPPLAAQYQDFSRWQRQTLHRRGARLPGELVARAPAGSLVARSRRRPPAPRRALVQGRLRDADGPPGARAAARGVLGGAGGDPLHDPLRGVQRAAPSRDRGGGHRGHLPVRQPQPGRDREPDRQLLRRPPPAHAAHRRVDLPRAAGADPRGDAGGARESGHPLRAGVRGAGDPGQGGPGGARDVPRPVPAHQDPVRRDVGGRRPPDGPAADRQRRDPQGSEPLPHPGGGARRPLQVQPRRARSGAGRPPARALPPHPRRRRRRSGAAGRRAARGGRLARAVLAVLLNSGVRDPRDPIPSFRRGNSALDRQHPLALPDHRPPRGRRHGGRLQGARPQARPPGGSQVPRRPARRLGGAQAAFPARGAGGVGARPSQRLHRLRDRRDGRRRPVHRHGFVLLRGDPARAARPRPAADRRGGRHRPADRRRPRPRPRAGDHSSRRQARQCHADPRRLSRRNRQAGRLRHRQAGRPVAAHPHRQGGGDGGLHVSRAVPRRARRSPHRRLVAGGGALRDGHRPPAVRGGGREADGARHPGARAAADGGAAPGGAAGARTGGRARPRQGAGGPLCADRGDALRPRGPRRAARPLAAAGRREHAVRPPRAAAHSLRAGRCGLGAGVRIPLAGRRRRAARGDGRTLRDPRGCWAAAAWG